MADHARMAMVPVAYRESYASAAAGGIAQNIYLFSASTGLSTVIRAWIDRTAIADALGLSHDQQVLLSQTVGTPGTAPKFKAQQRNRYFTVSISNHNTAVSAT